MAHTAKDGSRWTNASQARLADKSYEAKNSSPTPKVATATNPVEQTEPQESTDSSEVVAQHGPAKEVLVKHSEGKHHVKSSHEDGHVHESDHETASKAHDAARTLSGADEQESDPADISSDTGTDMGNPAAAMMG
jgi:hypothetical protein